MAGPCKFKHPGGCSRKDGHRGAHATLAELVGMAHARSADLQTADVNTLTRASLRAAEGHTLAVLDFSSVEARALAWAADDRKALKVFRTPGGDPYAVMAGTVYGVDWKLCTKEGAESWRRALGKILELGCGYGLGDRKFKTHAEKDGVKWDELPVTPKQAVTAYRELHAPIVRFWKELQRGGVAAVDGETTRVGPFVWGPSPLGEEFADNVWLMLPSGRPIVYWDLRTTRGKYGRELKYLGRKGWERTYGGKLTENAIQALCRDFLARALAEARAEGFRGVMHVHDEGVWEVRKAVADIAFQRLRAIMSTCPPWAEGMPLDCEGFLTERYKK